MNYPPAQLSKNADIIIFLHDLHCYKAYNLKGKLMFTYKVNY